MKNLYVIFYTSSEAMATEFACKENNIDGKLVPLPRIASASCGISFESKVENFEILKELLKKEDIEYEDIIIL